MDLGVLAFFVGFGVLGGAFLCLLSTDSGGGLAAGRRNSLWWWAAIVTLLGVWRAYSSRSGGGWMTPLAFPIGFDATVLLMVAYDSWLRRRQPPRLRWFVRTAWALLGIAFVVLTGATLWFFLG